MGPFVYVEQGSLGISTLLCRCMPAQAEKLSGAFMYDLLPATQLPAGILNSQPPSVPGTGSRFWNGQCATLESALRLPPAF